MRRLLFSIYALILVDEVLLLALVPLAPTYRDELGLSKTETGALLGASGFATVFISIPAGILADRIGARRLTIAAGFLLALAGLVQGLADEFWPPPRRSGRPARPGSRTRSRRGVAPRRSARSWRSRGSAP